MMLTLGELSRLLGVPSWKIRRATALIAPALSRIGDYRLIQDNMIPEIIGELQKQGWIAEVTPVDDARQTRDMLFDLYLKARASCDSLLARHWLEELQRQHGLHLCHGTDIPSRNSANPR